MHRIFRRPERVSRVDTAHAKQRPQCACAAIAHLDDPGGKANSARQMLAKKTLVQLHRVRGGRFGPPIRNPAIPEQTSEQTEYTAAFPTVTQK